MSPFARPDPRAVAAEVELLGLGLAGAKIEVGGHEGEIAVVRVAEAQLEALLGGAAVDIVARIKSLGFRYVALDLEATP